MANIQVKCPTCNKQVNIIKEFNNEILKKRFSQFECGHAVSSDIQVSDLDKILQIESKFRHHKPFKFQAETVQFIENAGLRGIINHEMGLGKMVIECLILKRNFEQMTPCLIACPAGITHQWYAHIVDWCEHIPQILSMKDSEPDFSFYKIFIVSVDTLWRLPWMQIKEKNKEGYGFKDIDTPEKRKIRETFKHICIDEVQRIKNNTAKRTQGVKTLGEGKKAITLSGTPIHKNAHEYFPCLNLVLPDIFPTETGYDRRFVNYNYYGQPSGMKNEESFRELTKDYIIRYTREEKLPDLPKIFRQFKSSVIEDKDLQAGYEKELDSFIDFMDGLENGPQISDMNSILGYFARMRHITGMSKVQPICDFVEQFLLETNRKITIFVYHNDVREMIKLKLSNIPGINPPVMITSDMNGEERLKQVQEFEKSENRILISFFVDGLNLQFCSDCIVAERHWTPIPEEQAESRFPRPGSTADKINSIYMIAEGTIDDLLTEKVERARAIIGQVVDGKSAKWDESSLVKDLALEIQKKGKQKWRASLL